MLVVPAREEVEDDGRPASVSFLTPRSGDDQAPLEPLGGGVGRLPLVACDVRELGAARGAVLEERFRDARQDGPSAYASFLASRDDEQQKARLRQDAVAIVREFLRAFREGR